MNNERIGRHLLPGFLMRLLRDVRGNALAIIAASVIPMAALAGSAIDMARLYVVKVRLQQACDAGVLAGRKFMDPNSNGPTLDDNAAKMAKKFFQNNFTQGWFATSSVTFTPTKTSDSQVSGVASTNVPLTVMGMFGFQASTLNVTCKARYDVADADIMFVLDTTGSMACSPADSQGTCDLYVVTNTLTNNGDPYVKEKSDSRIDDLRDSIGDFYDTLTSIADPTTHFRFGFVPYSSAVNVAGMIPAAYIAGGTYKYQTRTWTDTPNGKATVTTVSDTKAGCDARAGHAPYSRSGNTWVTSVTTTAWTPNNSGTGSGSGNGTCVVTTQPMIVTFTYKQADQDVTSYLSQTPVTNPTMPDGSKSTWKGCIEERGTTQSTTFDPTNLPPDLDPDLDPSGDNRWHPMWIDAVYDHKDATEVNTDATRTYTQRWDGSTARDGVSFNSLACPKQAQRLTEVDSKSDATKFVKASSGFLPYGNTYHDIGMTWGLRFLSSTGPFKKDTAAWPGRNSPNRFIVFLTDGVMEPSNFSYNAHGIEKWDSRVSTDGGKSDLTARHNARFLAVCQAAKNRNIKVFTIAFAQTITTELKTCASPNSWYYASDGPGLTKAFKAIAQQVAMLRIDQ